MSHSTPHSLTRSRVQCEEHHYQRVHHDGRRASEVGINVFASNMRRLNASAGFLLFRVLKTGRDERFDQIRNHFLKFLGKLTPQQCATTD